MTEKKFDQLGYIREYNKARYRHYHLYVPVDEEQVIEKLNEQKSKNGYLIDLIKKDIKGGK